MGIFQGRSAANNDNLGQKNPHRHLRPLLAAENGPAAWRLRKRGTHHRHCAGEMGGEREERLWGKKRSQKEGGELSRPDSVPWSPKTVARVCKEQRGSVRVSSQATKVIRRG